MGKNFKEKIQKEAALEDADRLDAAFKASGPVGPLHGIPVLIKDNIDTHDRMMTTVL